MKTQGTWLLALQAHLAAGILFATGAVLAQGPAPVQYPGYAPAGPMAGPMGQMSGRFRIPGAGPGMPGYMPQSMVQQASYAGCDSCAGMGCESCVSDCGPGGCGLLGGSLGQGMLGKANSRYGGFATMMHGQQNGPFGGGGCCTPIWHDFHIEAMHLRRDGVGDNLAITSDGSGGPIVLSTDDLDLGDAVGLRATYAFLIAPSTNLELTYFGLHDWSDSQSVTSNGDLWSVFSQFGAFSPQVGQQGFPQTVDAANFHSIDYSSEMHNLELNLRKRWVSAGCLLHGSYLAGVRYTSLHETFGHDTLVADGGFLNYDVETENDMVGFQIGTEMFVCVSPRFKVGAEIEAGLFGNDAEYTASVNTLEVNTNSAVAANPVNEFDDQTDVAFLSEASLIGMFRVTPRFTIRGGYTVLFMDGLALATENFNSTDSPFAAAGRTVSIRNQGEAFYHGANLGFTWMW